MKLGFDSVGMVGVFAAAVGVFGCASAGPGGASKSAPEADFGPSSAGEALAPQAAAKPSAPPSDSGATASPAQREAAGGDAASEPSNRPGLGTTWGETRDSRISTSPFTRADAQNPLATAMLFYNDEDGARSMANATGFRRVSEGTTDLGNGILSVRLKDQNGRFLSGFEAAGKDFIVGRAGERYSIVVHSHVPARLEVVVSVDGLDVIDGDEASFAKRGYLVDPHGSIEIDGFRQSMDTVAAFRFGSVRDSYAERKHGKPRNVGVIGIAAFHEQGSSPNLWPVGETKRRLDANPFPGQFATPPSR